MISIELKNILKNFIKNKKNTIYLETGFETGSSAETALNLNFSKVISIEIDQKRIVEGNKKFAEFIENKKLFIINGDSAEKIIEEYNENTTVIFLDAHGEYSNTDYNKVAPLEKELKYILPKLKSDQLIIIDDYLRIVNYPNYNKKNWKAHLSDAYFKSIIKDY